jgi:hypothetical protein
MMARLLSFTERPWTAAEAILYGTLAVGVLDGLDAVIVFGFVGATPTRIFQSIASGVLGRAAYTGGLPAALLGLVLHFVVAAGIVSTYVAVSRWIPALWRQPLLFGPLYGIAAYFVMNLVVVPLSAIGVARFSTLGVVNGLLIHALVVGPVSAIVAARAGAGRGSSPPVSAPSASLLPTAGRSRDRA